MPLLAANFFKTALVSLAAQNIYILFYNAQCIKTVSNTMYLIAYSSISTQQNQLMLTCLLTELFHV